MRFTGCTVGQEQRIGAMITGIVKTVDHQAGPQGRSGSKFRLLPGLSAQVPLDLDEGMALLRGQSHHSLLEKQGLPLSAHLRVERAVGRLPTLGVGEGERVDLLVEAHNAHPQLVGWEVGVPAVKLLVAHQYEDVPVRVGSMVSPGPRAVEIGTTSLGKVLLQHLLMAFNTPCSALVMSNWSISAKDCTKIKSFCGSWAGIGLFFVILWRNCGSRDVPTSPPAPRAVKSPRKR